MNGINAFILITSLLIMTLCCSLMWQIIEPFFVDMPFEKKTDLISGVEIDFDQIYESAINSSIVGQKAKAFGHYLSLEYDSTPWSTII